MAMIDPIGGGDTQTDPYASRPLIRRQKDDPFAPSPANPSITNTTQPAQALINPTTQWPTTVTSPTGSQVPAVNPFQTPNGTILSTKPENYTGSPAALAGYSAPDAFGHQYLYANGTQPTASGATATSGDPYGWVDSALSSAQSLDDPNYWKTQIAADNGAHPQSYWQMRIAQGDGSLAVRNGTAQPYGGSQSYGTSVFSDPATQQYEQLLNSLVGKLNTPYQAPDFQKSIDYLNSYMQQLQGPAYTPAQSDTIQTQATDPIERQRQAMRQQIVTQYANKGIPPSSGIVDAALAQVDNQFNTIRAQTQGAFASNAVNLSKQQQGQAAQLGPMISSLETAQHQGDLASQMQALNIAAQIPNMAWSRLQGANGLIQQTNPASLFSPLQSFQQQGYNQGAAYGSNIMQVLIPLLFPNGIS